LNELESTGSFEPGALECRLEEGVDLSTDEGMMIDLEALAETCPQQRLIQFLRAAAFVSVVPVGIAAPGARMDPAVVQELRVKLAFASRAIAELGLYLQDDLVPPEGSVPKRLRTILRNALAERSVAEVMSDGEKAERLFPAKGPRPPHAGTGSRNPQRGLRAGRDGSPATERAH
jgi:hypothetical protein